MSADLRAPRPLSGKQVHLEFGEYTADIASIGASLRTLRHGARDLVTPYAADSIRPVARGALLVPWPNRLGGGQYTFDGATHRVPLTEPDKNNALHGLATWADWTVTEADAQRATLAYRIPTQDGYPFDVLVEVTYALGETGLACTVRATNLGESRAPYGLGSHPYVVAGPGRVDDWSVTVPAAQVLEVSADRLLPRALHPVEEFEAGRLDFRSSRAIEATTIDHAFTGLQPGPDGMVSVEVRAAAGTGVAVTWRASALGWVQIHTADRPEADLNRCGLAVEPMTCPPDAFNSGTDLVVLEPGAVHEASWSIAAL